MTRNYHKHSSGQERCPYCGRILKYNPNKSRFGNYKYLYFDCSFCMCDIRVAPSGKPEDHELLMAELRNDAMEEYHQRVGYWHEEAMKRDEQLELALQLLRKAGNYALEVDTKRKAQVEEYGKFLLEQGYIDRVSIEDIEIFKDGLLKSFVEGNFRKFIELGEYVTEFTTKLDLQRQGWNDITKFLYDEKKIEEPTKIAMLKYALKRLRKETRAEIQKKLDEVRDRIKKKREEVKGGANE